MSAENMIAGICSCGALRYEVEGPIVDLTHCHCVRCRKHHGAPFASYVEVPLGAFRWVAGEARVADFSAPATRSRRFCEVCGAVAPLAMGDRFLVPAGNLLGDWVAAAGRHVCVASKPEWHVIGDALPQHPAGAPGWTCEGEGSAAPSAEGSTRGSCLCGEVTFAVRGEPGRWLQCHCSRCRRARSAAHGSNTFYPLAQFSWQTGREQVRSYRPPDAARFAVSFCARCGGGAPVERENVPFVLVPAGLFDADPGARPQAHIHMASKSSWYSFHDDLPQFAELPA